MNNTYWNENGKYQKQTEFLSKLVPETGSCNDRMIDNYRIMCNLYYRVFNGGDYVEFFEYFDLDNYITTIPCGDCIDYDYCVKNNLI